MTYLNKVIIIIIKVFRSNVKITFLQGLKLTFGIGHSVDKHVLEFRRSEKNGFIIVNYSKEISLSLKLCHFSTARRMKVSEK